jgi:aspartokinase-like uncharacterized kinase
MPPIVVKLGGSHANSPALQACLHTVAACAGRVVLVPGGGPFADAVRRAQPAMGFDDRAAHQMALLAMAQFGVALTSLAPTLSLALDIPAINGAIAARRVPVWSPWPMLSDAPDIAESWDVTSDSLALWLASRLHAERVVLVKRAEPRTGATAAGLAASGFVDAAFPRFRAAFPGSVRFATPDNLAETLPAPASLPAGA